VHRWQPAVTILSRSRHRGNVAAIEAQIGKQDAAIDRIERLLAMAYGAFPLTQAKLRTNPEWDPLRTHPRFKALVDGPEPKTVYLQPEVGG
jgi:hypothetical protein